VWTAHPCPCVSPGPCADAHSVLCSAWYVGGFQRWTGVWRHCASLGQVLFMASQRAMEPVGHSGAHLLSTRLPQCDGSSSPAQGQPKQAGQGTQPPGPWEVKEDPLAGLATRWDLARHGAVSPEGQAVPGTGHLQTLRSGSEPLGLGEEMAARAGPEQDPGRRPREGSGRKAQGWAGWCAGSRPSRSSQRG